MRLKPGLLDCILKESRHILDPMNIRLRNPKLGLLLLGIPLLLWILALLFLFRVVNIFDKYLMKFPGPLVIWGILLLFPVGAVFLGRRMIREQQKVNLGRTYIVLGGIMVIGFVLIVLVPMIQGALEPKIPSNPSTPRPYEPQTGIPVFPGAEGFGTHTIAGRGGKVIEVTSLEDSGPGSLRAAIEDPNPRIIIFRVGGTIELESTLQINNPFVTIAGQTAPGGGIALKNAGLVIATHDVLVQHLRVRPGNEGDVEPDINDAIEVLGDHGDVAGAYNVVLDHVSASWSEDEVVSTWYGAHDITISWSVISEGLNRSRHRKETHSAGLLIGNSSYNVSVHHTLLAHNDFRNPLIVDGGTHDFINNVIYNWGVLPAEIIDEGGNTFLNFIGNTYIPGPSSELGLFEVVIPSGEPKIYVEDNIGPHRPTNEIDDWAMVGFGYGEGIAPETLRSMTSYETPHVTILKAAEAKERVLQEAGAIFPSRDAVDTRIVEDVLRGTGSIIDSPEEVGGYPPIAMGAPLLDSDHDGMPDDWELAVGLDPNDASDSSGDLDDDGYTNIEEYLHHLSKLIYSP